MNKEQLIKSVSDRSKLTQKDVGVVLDSLVSIIKDTIKGGDKVTIAGFGVFEAYTRKATTGVNPRTKEKINIPSKKVAKFKVSSVLQEFLKD